MRRSDQRRAAVVALYQNDLTGRPLAETLKPDASLFARALAHAAADRAEELGREELEETRIGRLAHKIEKLKVIADRIPGVEFLKTDAFSGENGISLQEYAPFGVIGAVTPVTHSLPTLACNAINMLAGGNSLVCNPHPSGARIACKGTQLFNKAIHEAIGIDNESLVASACSERLHASVGEGHGDIFG